MRMPPPGACDAHIHIIGPFDRFPLNDDRSYTPVESPVEEWQGVMKVLGIDRAVIVHPSCHGMKLEVTIDALAKMGKRARGVAVVKPDVSDEELDRLHAAGFRGVRVVTLVRGGVSPEALAGLSRRIARLGWHAQLLIDGRRDMEALVPILRELPVPYVIDTMGNFGPDGIDHPGFKALLKLMESGDCWSKLIGPERRTKLGPPYADITPFAKALIDVRPDRLVWGTDWPHIKNNAPFEVPNDADLLEWIYSMDLGEKIEQAILVENPAKLYEFDPL